MNYERITKFERWILTKIAKRLVIQGFSHDWRIRQYYSILISAARKEFTEDNKTILDHFLREQHEKALKYS